MKRVLRVGMLVESPGLRPEPRRLAAILERRGGDVRVIDPQVGVRWLDADRLLTDCDVVVACGNSWETLCLLGLAEARGIATVNRRAAVAAVHNKAEMAASLAAAGIPTPAAFVGLPAALAQACADAGAFPVLVRHIFGDTGTPAYIVRTANELAAMRFTDPWLAQSLVTGPVYQLKLFGIGSDVWSLRRPVRLDGDDTPPSSPVAMIYPQPASREQCALAHRCQDLFGLDVYGVECIDSAAGALVLDVDDDADFSGIDDAADRFAQLILRRAGRARPQGRSMRPSANITPYKPRTPPPGHRPRPKP